MSMLSDKYRTPEEYSNKQNLAEIWPKPKATPTNILTFAMNWKLAPYFR